MSVPFVRVAPGLCNLGPTVGYAGALRVLFADGTDLSGIDTVQVYGTTGDPDDVSFTTGSFTASGLDGVEDGDYEHLTLEWSAEQATAWAELVEPRWRASDATSVPWLAGRVYPTAEGDGGAGDGTTTVVAIPGADAVQTVYVQGIGPAGADGAGGDGSGDVVGPASATDGNLAAFDGATGKLLGDSGYGPSDLLPRVIPVVYFYRTDTTRSTCTVVPGTGGAVNLPAGVLILLDGQATSSENGLYRADGSGGVDVGSKVDIKTVDYFGHIIVANTIWGERDGEDALNFELLEPYLADRIDNNLTRSMYAVFSPDGVNYSIEAFQLSHATWMNGFGDWVAPAMVDYSISYGDTDAGTYQLGIHHGINVVDSSGGDITITLGPHATIPRHCYIWHRTGDNTVTIENLAGDGNAFSYTLPRGEMVLILPDAASWHAWRIEKAGQHMLIDSAEGASAPWNLDGLLIDHSHVVLTSVDGVTLPQAANVADGHQITFYNLSGSAMTLTIGTAVAEDTFEGAAASVDVALPDDGEVTVFRLPAGLGYQWLVDQRSGHSLGYTPTTDGDWSEGVPDDVGEALDALAGRSGGSLDELQVVLVTEVFAR